MSDFVCKECGKEFKTRKSFHCHLKAHSLTIGDYYVKHFQKKDLFTGDLLQFKSYDFYFSHDFNNFGNYVNWLRTEPESKARDYVFGQAQRKFQDKKIEYSPPNLFYDLSFMANIYTYRKLWGSYDDFTKEAKIENIYKKDLPKGFWDADVSGMNIFVDTREKKPLKFDNGTTNKLDFGDYTAAGEYYTKTFVDRKAQDDFRQTFGAGIERFRREMDRCVHFGSYMFVVVESSIEKLEEDNKLSKFKSNLGYVWHNVRQLMLDYPKNIQFIFAHNRAGTKKIIPLILRHGDELWNVDLQYHIDKKIHGVGQRKTSISE
jgi:ERCC4-type nuclease